MDKTSHAIVTPPPSGEAPRAYREVVEAALAALPPDLPTDPSQLLIGLDIDGTLITRDGASTRVREAFHALTEAGAHPVVTTGRSPGATVPVMQMLDADTALVVCSNGAVFTEFHPRHTGGACVQSARYFEVSEVLDRALDAVPGALIGVEADFGYLLSQSFPAGEFIENIRIATFDELRNKATAKMVIRAPWMDVPEFSQMIAESDLRDTHEVFVGWTSWADVGPLGVTKASALAQLAQDFGIPPQGTIAVGDGTNDVPMFDWARFAVSMGGAHDSVKASADYVTASVENDGSAALMDALLIHCGVKDAPK